jgi:hypothetical protein
MVVLRVSPLRQNSNSGGTTLKMGPRQGRFSATLETGQSSGNPYIPLSHGYYPDSDQTG